MADNSAGKVYPEPGIGAEDGGEPQARIQSMPAWQANTNRTANDKHVVGKTRQAHALAAKAVSYQSRQLFTNICCISLCPLMMVAIAAFLGNLIVRLINNANPLKEYIQCSNVNASNSLNIPFWKTSDARLPSEPGTPFIGATTTTMYHVNWARVASLLTSGPPGAASATFQQPCTFWYGERYPYSSTTPYDRDPGATGKSVRDSTYTGQPVGGWFNALATGFASGLVDSNTANIFGNKQLRSWAIYGVDPSVTPALVGTKARESDLTVAQFVALSSPAEFVSPSSAATGLLGTIPTRYWQDTSSLSLTGQTVGGFVPVPYYVASTGSTGSSDDLDDQISSALNTIILEIAKLDKTALLGSTNDLVATNNLFIKIGKILQQLPHGALYFKKIDHTNKQYAFNMHYGTDIRLTGSSNFPKPGSRLIAQLTQLTNAILRNSDPARFGAAAITQGFRILPQLGSNAIYLPFGGLIGAILYPFGVSFLLPIFVITLVQEKEYRILVMMKMNGMKELSYYISHYIVFFILYVISTAIFLISGYVSKLTIFTVTETGVLILLFFLWGNVQIALAFFFATLFNKSRLALVIVFLLVLCSVIISLAMADIFDPAQMPAAIFLWPPFAFYRALSLVNKASYEQALRPYRISDLVGSDEVLTSIIFMAFEIPVILLVTAYLTCIFPTEFGVHKPWHFPVTDVLRAYRRYQRKKAGLQTYSEEDLAMSVKIDEKETQFEDADVKAERARIVEGKYDPKCPLIMKNMRKVYAGRGGAGPKLAVKDVTFAVEEGIVFGLLGPNGAGKTTLISILTGLYEASTGHATLAGYDIKTETAEVYKRIGICPQFDILWEELTVGEHLYFYARLKGIPYAFEKSAIQAALESVALTRFETRLTKGLSGGERRRLSIAIALLGSPSVIFFDEPTTGLDPEVRRLIWNMVNKAREGKTIILTTHSMEEAEALCQRIGIMAKGTLRCIANPLRLKDLYGSGFKLFFNSNVEDTERAALYVESLLPLFEKIEAEKANYGILDWGIGQTTLEEVFIRLISESDASAEY
ncbi:hypothetical protein BC831DRAFT_549185 [Entophlyctis helioformis]|nr:hypothetical protein BC831DRAFT_549185 [Entophlyctis helioformis]